jgi:hypothetical protein
MDAQALMAERENAWHLHTMKVTMRYRADLQRREMQSALLSRAPTYARLTRVPTRSRTRRHVNTARQQ